ncbi:MAG: type II toxin-antitoxin system HicB family antitoxin [Defluviitaleaceae bacterium]|nr:type II toxin-antitoxin system HicB family antitoxin [Defluviitaleaceae bacterium]
MKDTYVYPAVVSVDDDGISVEFPDLPGCLSCADTTEEAAKNANETLRLHLWSMEKDNDSIPNPSDIRDLHLEPKQIPLLVEVFMPPVRERQANRYVKKTLSIPSWLNAEAERAGVNFSQILQAGIKEHLKLAK